MTIAFSVLGPTRKHGPSRWGRGLPLGVVVSAILTLAIGTGVSAADFIVTQLTDSNDGVCDVDCSLRDAILAANALAGEDRVLLGEGVHTLSLLGSDEDLGATGDLDITDDTILLGLGARLSIIDGGAIDRVLDAASGTTSRVEGLTIRNGMLPTGSGAGINAGNADVTLVDCMVTGNHVGGFGSGGGLAGDMMISGSTISNNSADGSGGGLVTSSSTVVNSTFSGNQSLSDFGGGMYVFSFGNVTIDNVSMIDNQASIRGGGLLIEGDATVSVANSVLASNSSGSGGPDCSGPAMSRGYNLVGNGSFCTGFGATGDQVGSDVSPIDPVLTTLGNFGGPTDVHRPDVGSPLIDTGNPAAVGSSSDACAKVDQAGIQRPLDGDRDSIARCDVGAVEGGLIFVDGFESADTSFWTLTFP